MYTELSFEMRVAYS